MDLSIRLTRMRMFALIDAFERDLRDALQRYVLEDLDSEVALGDSYDRAVARQAKDSGEATEAEYSLVEYLDLKEAYDLLNRHRALVPEMLGRELRELTPNVDRLVQIRNRVMHGRPLGAGDPDALSSLLAPYVSLQWKNLKNIWSILQSDPLWEPNVSVEPNPANYGFALHNLPLPDYDETGLIGREKDVRQLVSMCKRKRENIITITGEGGIGKTALALEVAYRIVDDTDRPYDAVLWSSLKTERLTAQGVRQISHAISTLTGAFESMASVIDENPLQSFEELAEILEGLNVLIVLDNLETINSTNFLDLYEMLPDTVSFLVTSRVGIGEVERRYPLVPLPEKDSVRLLTDLVNRRNVAALRSISFDTRIEVINRLRRSPLAIRWFVLAVEAGREPLSLIRNQGELLEFCVRSVYDSLGVDARRTLQALHALGRPVTSDELVLLTRDQVDQISRAIKVLTTGSLVTVNSARDGHGSFTVGISESATQFLQQADLTNAEYIDEIVRRDAEFRVAEERRARESSERTLAPIVVRVRNQGDVATAQLLRRALLASQADDYSEASRLITQARALNAEFWEVDRVDAFICAAQGQYAAATPLYLRAYRNAMGEHRAVVAHFLAGHLARHVKDMTAALRYAREAHETIDIPETAVAYGNYLVWNLAFKEGIQLIEPAIESSTGRARLIAATCAIEAHRRYAEYIRDHERSPLLAFDEAWQGFCIAAPLLKEGVVDNRLLHAATGAATEACSSLCMAAENSVTLPVNTEMRINTFIEVAGRLSRSSNVGYLISTVGRLARCYGVPECVLELRERLNEPKGGNTDWKADSELIGNIHSVVSTYGFIEHPNFPDRLFFHKSDCVPAAIFDDLCDGSQVRFTVTMKSERLRATNVSLAQ
jgi:tetratricopeptide (TPR) repeat protein/cold shock CspA family protein